MAPSGKGEPFLEASPVQSISGQSTGKKAVNGFFSIAEPEAIVVDEEHIACMSLPEEVLRYHPPENLIVYQFKNGDKERKIHCNTALTDVENAQLKKMQQEARSRNLEFFPSVSVAATRYLSRARGDVKKGLQLMIETQEWRANYFSKGPITSASVADDLNLGIIYFVGRDKDLRPTLLCRASRIPNQWFAEKQTDRLVRLVIFCLEYMQRYMCFPGKVEGNNLIFDLKGLSASQVPLKELSKMYSVTSHHYMGRVFKCYVVNLSTMLSMIASAVKQMLTDRQKQKLVFQTDIKGMREDFALHQLEEDMGGSRPLLKTFFPFPLHAGPFQAGDSTGPTANAVKQVAGVLTNANCRGRLWDTRKSLEENIRMDYPVEAVEIFKSLSLPVPESLVEKAERVSMRQSTLAALMLPEVAAGNNAPSTAKVADTPTSCLPSSPSVPLAAQALGSKVYEALEEATPPGVTPKVGPFVFGDDDERSEGEIIYDDAKEELVPDITGEEVSPSSFFDCRCCTVNNS